MKQMMNLKSKKASGETLKAFNVFREDNNSAHMKLLQIATWIGTKSGRSSVQ